MQKTTKQGVRDLNSFGPKVNLNGRRDHTDPDCFHDWADKYDAGDGLEAGSHYQECRKCGDERF